MVDKEPELNTSKNRTPNSQKDYLIDPQDVTQGDQISEGGQGEIFKGTYNGKNVVIKNFKASIYNEREIQAYTQLTHEFMVRFYGYFIDKHQNINLVLDYAEGEDLSNLILENKLNYKQKLQIIKKLAKFLVYLRKEHVIHRDLKPQNIKAQIIDEENIDIKILDFGISKISNISVAYTKQNVGSLAYAPPEIFSSQNDDEEDQDQVQVSYKFDIWSLGMIACYIFTGISPPWASNNKTVRREFLLLFIERMLITQAKFKVPDSLEDKNIKKIVSLCTQVTPEERINPATLENLLARIEQNEDISNVSLSKANFE